MKFPQATPSQVVVGGGGGGLGVRRSSRRRSLAERVLVFFAPKIARKVGRGCVFQGLFPRSATAEFS